MDNVTMDTLYLAGVATIAVTGIVALLWDDGSEHEPDIDLDPCPVCGDTTCTKSHLDDDPWNEGTDPHYSEYP